MSRLKFRVAVAVAMPALLIMPPNLGAQALRTGDRIRIKAMNGGATETIGIYQASEAENLVMLTSQTTRVEVPWDDLSRIQLSRGEHSNAGKGALIGLAVGGGLGLVIGIVAAAQGDVESGWLVWEAPDAGDVAKGVLGFSAFGAGVGALIGLASKSERWQTIPRQQWQIQLKPDLKGGVTLGLNLRL